MLCKIIFVFITLVASAIDIKYHIVPWYILAGIISVGIPSISKASFTGLLIGFIPMFVVAMLTDLGGGDVKFTAACGFFLKGKIILFATIIGLAAALIIIPVYLKIKHKRIKGTGFALVPFLTLGSIITLFL